MTKVKRKQTLDRLEQIDNERSKLLSDYQKLYFKKFKKCNHFVVISGVVENREKNDVYYGCIKCGLDERAGDYSVYDFKHDPMKAFFEYCGCYEFSKSMRRKLNSDGNLDFYVLKEACAKILSKKPDINNDELERKLTKLFSSSKKTAVRGRK